MPTSGAGSQYIDAGGRPAAAGAGGRAIGGPVKFVLCLVLCVIFWPALAAEPSVIGEWRLAGQFYNGGGHNFAEDAPELRLSFAPAADGGTPAGRVAWAGWTAAWPVWPGPDGPARLETVTVRGDGARIEAEYRVLPAPGDDTVLVVHEACAPTSATALSCEVRVRFERAGQSAGGFTWRRTFVREGSR